MPKIGQIVYWARIQHTHNMYDLIELYVRTVEEEQYFVGVDKRTKQAHMFSKHALDDFVFFNREEALLKLRREEERLNKK